MPLQVVTQRQRNTPRKNTLQTRYKTTSTTIDNNDVTRQLPSNLTQTRFNRNRTTGRRTRTQQRLNKNQSEA
jgi:hypothetical protein